MAEILLPVQWIGDQIEGVMTQNSTVIVGRLKFLEELNVSRTVYGET